MTCVIYNSSDVTLSLCQLLGGWPTRADHVVGFFILSDVQFQKSHILTGILQAFLNSVTFYSVLEDEFIFLSLTGLYCSEYSEVSLNCR